MMDALEVGRVNVAARGVGIAQRALELALRYSQERKTFGKPIAQHQAIQFKLADMATKVEAARLLTLKAARLKDAGERSDLEAGMAKLFASEAGKEVVEESLPHPRRLRLLEGVRDRAPLPRRAATADRRGHLRDPAHGDRQEAAGAQQDLSVAPFVTGSNRGIGPRDRPPARSTITVSTRCSAPRALGSREFSPVDTDGISSPLAPRLDVPRRRERRSRAAAGIEEANPGTPRRAGQQRRRLRVRPTGGRRLRPRRGPRRDRDESVRALADDPGVAAAPAPQSPAPRESSTSPAAAGNSPRWAAARTAYRLSKAGLNALTRTLAADEAGSGLLVNSVCPAGFGPTWEGPAASPRSVQEGADTAIWLATMPDGGPTGGFFRNREPIPW